MIVWNFRSIFKPRN